ncbi:NADPH-dependent FMN reductase [Levilactobacillus bambusae]|uniref:Flavin reductase n=1 Tax=Levilactobacillus bambusae TaxID=2024736 RepID=A0A2V1N0C3_9LACO|nr:NADPH-dependent FMN reductase [Levilactobacillus bambusae]PWG00188.1 flavin reductase [Levilactobacillus bambusae]
MTKPTFVGIVGTNASFSYNRILLQYMQSHFADYANLEIAEIKDVPLFNEDLLKAKDIPASVQDLTQQIEAADGVIFATPEYDHAIPSSLKSVLEWLSSYSHPLQSTPTMIVGASYGIQGTVRAQMNLRDIIDSPGVNAITMPNNEFMLPRAQDQFDDNQQLTDAKTIKFLDQCFNNFIKFADQMKEDPFVG